MHTLHLPLKKGWDLYCKKYLYFCISREDAYGDCSLRCLPPGPRYNNFKQQHHAINLGYTRK